VCRRRSPLAGPAELRLVARERTENAIGTVGKRIVARGPHNQISRVLGGVRKMRGLTLLTKTSVARATSSWWVTFQAIRRKSRLSYLLDKTYSE